MPADPLVLTLNAGSSSLKFAAFDGPTPVDRGKVEVGAGGHPDAVRGVLGRFAGRPVAAVGHRVLHGGDRFTAPAVADPDVLAALDELVPLGPLHQPHNLAGVRAAAAALAGVRQVVCFDTAFHAAMPRHERMFGLPRRLFDAGVKRYGFHGLAYESVVEKLSAVDPAAVAGRLIACHLGNGASLCGMVGGKSVATTMGFTPLDGLLMGTRCGHLDPGVVLYLQRHDGLSADQVDHLLERESGLLGVSGGLSSDMRRLLESPDPRAAEAVELFCYRVARDVGAMAAAAGGVDAVAFSGGVGENAPRVREDILRRLGWLGADPDPAASKVRVHVVAADEEAVIARHTRAVLGL